MHGNFLCLACVQVSEDVHVCEQYVYVSVSVSSLYVPL